jgi:CHASE2 domain-containing sensor protein
MKSGGLSNFRALVAILVLIGIEAAAINYLGRNNYLPEGSEHWTEDWLIRYFSKRLDKPYKDIALIAVDAESLEKAGLPGTPPADRGWMAQLIKAVADARALAIGLDFYFITPRDPVKDEKLVAAMREAKVPVVIAGVDGAFLETEAQKKFQREFEERVHRPFGHIYLKRSQEILSMGDKATRAIDHGPSESGFASLTSVIASQPEVVSVFGTKDIPSGPQRIDWLLAPKGGEAFSSYSAYEVLAPEPGASAPDLKGKIVLIGPDFTGLDQHSVPFSLGSGQAVFPGVFVQAQALAQILDNRFFFNWTSSQQFLLLLIVGVAGGLAGWAFHDTRIDIILGIGGTLLLVALSVPFFIVRIPFPTALAILIWALSLSTGQRGRVWQHR